MHRQLQTIADEFLTALDRLHALAGTVPAERWGTRPPGGGWSVGECVTHLNLTADGYLPLLRGAAAEARALGGPAPTRYRRGISGWLLWRTMGPPVRIRTRTTPAFMPAAAAPPAGLVAEFERLQDAQMAVLRAVDELPIDQVSVASPFNPRLRYNLFACLGILARHQHRHLWQAEQVWARLARAAR